MDKISFMAAFAQSGVGYRRRKEVAALAQVELLVMNYLFLSQPVDQQEAERVLLILSKLSGQTYSFMNVDVRTEPVH